MRKFSKVFALLLAVCLISTAFITTVFSADKDSVLQVKGSVTKIPASGMPSNGVLNYAAQTHDQSEAGDKLSYSGSPSYWAGDGSTNFVDRIRNYVKVSDTGNTYIQTRYNYTSTGNSTSGYLDFKVGDYEHKNHTPPKIDAPSTATTPSAFDFDYMVLDFELSSDMYVANTVQGKFENKMNSYLTDNPEISTKLAYNEDFDMVLHFRTYNKKNGTDNWQTSYFSAGKAQLTLDYLSDSTHPAGWYLVYAGDKSQAAPLSNELGKWNHISYVLDIEYKSVESNGYNSYDFSDSKVYVLVNGTHYITMKGFLGKITVSPAAIASPGASYTFPADGSQPEWLDTWLKKCVAVQGLRMTYKGFSGKGAASLKDNFSMCWDNFSVHYYGDGKDIDGNYSPISNYEGDLGKYISDNTDALVNPNDANIPSGIYDCKDVVFNRNYVFDNKYISVDTGITKIYIDSLIDAELQKITDGTVLETYRNIHDFTPPESVNSFEVYLKGDATFTLSEEALAVYTIEPSALGYRVSKKVADDNSITIRWLDSKNGSIIKEEILKEGVVPTPDQTMLDRIVIINYATGEAKSILVSSWEWDIDADGNSVINRAPEPIRALTLNEINLAKQYCDGGILEIYPAEYEELSSVNLLYSLHCVNKLGNDVIVWDSEGSIDSYKDASTFVEMVNNAPDGAILILYSDIEIDESVLVAQNKSLYADLNGYELISNAENAFAVGNGSKLYVYSSMENGAVYATNNFVTTVGVNTYFNNCDIYLGDFGDYSGNNLFVIAEGLLFDIRSESGTANDGNNINVNIKNGIYCGGFDFAAPDIFVSIDDALVVSSENLFNYNDMNSGINVTEAKVSVKNSELYSVDSIIGEWGECCELYIEGSKVASSLMAYNYTDEKVGTVILGKDNYLAYDERDAAYVNCAENVAYAVTSADVEFTKLPDTFTYNAPVITFDLTGDNSEAIAEVIWKDALGNVYKEEYYHKDYASVNHPTDMSDMTRFPAVKELENSWFDIGYTTWENAEEGMPINSLKMGETNVFVPVAAGPVASVDAKMNLSLDTTAPKLVLYITIPNADGDIIFDANSGITVTDSYGFEVAFKVLENPAGAEGTYGIFAELPCYSFDIRKLTVFFAVSGFDGNNDGMVEKTDEDIVYMSYMRSIVITPPPQTRRF